MDHGEGWRQTRRIRRSKFDEAKLQRFGQQAGSLFSLLLKFLGILEIDGISVLLIVEVFLLKFLTFLEKVTLVWISLPILPFFIGRILLGTIDYLLAFFFLFL